MVYQKKPSDTTPEPAKHVDTSENNNDDDVQIVGETAAPAKKPSSDSTTAITLETANYTPALDRSAKSMQTFHTMAHVQAPKLPADLLAAAKAETPLHISAVMDVSASMKGKKIQMAKQALKFVAEQLSEKDEFGVVAFNDSVQAQLPMTPMGASGAGKAKMAIDRMTASGTTHLSGGLFAGVDQVQGRRVTNTTTTAPPIHPVFPTPTPTAGGGFDLHVGCTPNMSFHVSSYTLTMVPSDPSACATVTIQLSHPTHEWPAAKMPWTTTWTPGQPPVTVPHQHFSDGTVQLTICGHHPGQQVTVRHPLSYSQASYNVPPPAHIGYHHTTVPTQVLVAPATTVHFSCATMATANGNHATFTFIPEDAAAISRITITSRGRPHSRPRPVTMTWRPGQPPVTLSADHPSFTISAYGQDSRQQISVQHHANSAKPQPLKLPPLYDTVAVAVPASPRPVASRETLNISYSNMNVNGVYHYTVTFISAANTKVQSIATDLGGVWAPGGSPIQFQSARPLGCTQLTIQFVDGRPAAHETLRLNGAKSGSTQITLVQHSPAQQPYAPPAHQPVNVDPFAEFMCGSVPVSASPVRNKKATRVVLLFTDGQANVGITNEGALNAELQRRLGTEDADITVFTFGFGADHNATMLRSLAEISQGTYYYVQQADQMPEIFADCLGGLQSIVARDLKLTLRPVPGIQVVEVMTKFPQKTESGGRITVAMKDLYSEEERDVVVKLSVDTRAIATAGAKAVLVQWTLEYTPTTSILAKGPLEAAAEVICHDGPVDNLPVNDKVDTQIQRYQATQALEEARREADQGRFDNAQMAIAKARSRVSESKCRDSLFGRALDDNLERVGRQATSASAWQQGGQKEANQYAAMHGMQRAAYAPQAAMGGAQMYATSNKMHLQQQARLGGGM